MQGIRNCIILRSSLVAPARRAFSATPRFQKDAADQVKETADAVSKKAGEAMLKGVIEPSEKAAEALKSAVGVGSQKAAEATKDVRGKAGAAAEDIKGKATDASYEAEKMKAEGGKQINQAATEAKKAAQ